MQQFVYLSQLNVHDLRQVFPVQSVKYDDIVNAVQKLGAERLFQRVEKVPARIIMQVHDELVFEVATDAVDAVREGVRHHMSTAADLRVPLKVEVGVGVNWDEAH